MTNSSSVWRFAAVCVVSAGIATAAPLFDWPQFGGCDRNNVTETAGLFESWPEGGPKLLWTASGCGKGYSSPAVVQDLRRGTKGIFTAGTVGGQTQVIAFDFSGKTLWKAPNGKPWIAPPNMKWAKAYDGSRSTPTVVGDLVLHLGELGALTAFKAATGEVVWTVNLAERFAATPPEYGYAESVLVDGDRVICYAGGKSGSLVAVKLTTGETVWANTEVAEPTAYASVIVVDAKGLRQLVTMSENGALGFNADNGKLLWRYPLTNKRQLNCTTPVCKDGDVLISNGYGGASVRLRLDVKDGAVTPVKVWESKDLDNKHGGVLLLDGVVYGSGDESVGWTALDWATGKTFFRERPFEKGSIAAAGNRLFCLSEKGDVALVAPSREKLDIRGRFHLPKSDNGPVWAHPVIGCERLYLRHGDLLYAYEICDNGPR